VRSVLTLASVITLIFMYASCCIDNSSPPENGAYLMTEVDKRTEIVEAAMTLGDDMAVLTYTLDDGSMWGARFRVVSSDSARSP
jgi:hypothetical protein